MNSSKKILDSITITDNWVQSQNETIGVLLQNSIRYEKFKRFAVYHGQNYIGDFECCAKSVMKFEEITESMCKLLFGDVKHYSKSKIQHIFKKGRFSEKNSEFCFIVLFRIGYSSQFEIKRGDARI